MPAQAVAESDRLAEQALAEFLQAVSATGSNETTVATLRAGLRWYPKGEYPNQSVIILPTGKSSNRKVFATISRNGKLAKYYSSWVPVLDALHNEKQARGVSRMSHEGIETGIMP